MPERPDEEDISLVNAVERAFHLAAYSLADKEGYMARDIAFKVARLLYLKWKHEASFPPEEVLNGTEPGKKRHHIPTNRAFDIDLTAFDALEPYKVDWVNTPTRPLDTETVDCWFLEDTVNYVLTRHSMYVGVGVGNVVFGYDNTQVQKAVQELNEEILHTHAKYKDAEFRRAKRFILAHYFSQNKKGEFKSLVGRFLKKVSHPEDKNETRFAARPKSDESSEFVKRTLEHLTPLQPDCPFPRQFYASPLVPLEEGLEFYVRRNDVYKTPDGIDRVRMHVLLDPKCWVRVYEMMERKLPIMQPEMPDYSTASRVDPTSRPPSNRNSPPQRTKSLKKEAMWRLRQFITRHETFSARSVKFVVNDAESCELDLERPQTIPGALTLDEGDNIIKIFGFDGETSLPVGMHILPWGKHQVGERPVRYVTELDGGRWLEFLVKYEKDEDGEPISATVDVTYALEAPEAASVTPRPEKPVDVLKPAYALRAAVAVFAISALAATFATYTYLVAPGENPGSLESPSRLAANTVTKTTKLTANQSGGVLTPSGSMIINANAAAPNSTREDDAREHESVAAARASNTNNLPSQSTPGDPGSAAATLHSLSVTSDRRADPVAEIRKVQQRGTRQDSGAQAKLNRAVNSISDTGQGLVGVAERRLSGLQSTGRPSAGRRGKTFQQRSRSPRRSSLASGKRGGTAASTVARLSITVKDANNKSLPQAMIELRDVSAKVSPIGVVSNDEGTALCCHIYSGTYDYSVVKKGFRSAKGRLVVRGSRTTEYEITLQPQRSRGKSHTMSRVVSQYGGSLNGCQKTRPARRQVELGRVGIPTPTASIRPRLARQ